MSTPDSTPSFPSVFIGSSGESKAVAAKFAVELQHHVDCHPIPWWPPGTFTPSGNALQALITHAGEVDFAVFVAAPDDTTKSRGAESSSIRDNVLFEFALFVGSLGLNRTYLLVEKGTQIKLPSDINGLTVVGYNKLGTNTAANSSAFLDAALRIGQSIGDLGLRNDEGKGDSKWAEVQPRRTGEQRLIHSGGKYIMLSDALERICKAAAAQGWTLKARTEDRLRLVNPRSRQRHTLVVSPGMSAWELHKYVSTLRADGLRLSHFFPAKPLS